MILVSATAPFATRLLHYAAYFDVNARTFLVLTRGAILIFLLYLLVGAIRPGRRRRALIGLITFFASFLVASQVEWGLDALRFALYRTSYVSQMVGETGPLEPLT